MSLAVVKQDANSLSTKVHESELIDVLATSLYPGASVGSIKLVLSYCKASGLDPMQKPVHIVPMWDGKTGMMRDVVMPGIGLYRTQAARNGCAGVGEPEFGPDITETIGGASITYPQWCRITVKRKLSTGDVVDFTAKEFWRENYAVRGGKDKSIAPNAMWTKRPYGQLAKCAEAQALRKAFPEIGSEPTADEMAGKSINDYDITIDASTGEILTPKFDVHAALDQVHQCKTVAELEQLFQNHGALAANAKDKGGYKALRDAVREKKKELTPPADTAQESTGDAND